MGAAVAGPGAFSVSEQAVVISGPAAWSAGGGPVILELRGVRKEYPVTAGAVMQRKVGSVQAVRGIDLVLRQGESLGVVGESGCGKSTLGRMIVGLERPTGGQVLFEGTDLTKLRGSELRRRHRDLQLMFQDPYSSLDPRMRVGSIIREPLVVQGIGSPAEQRERVSALLREVGLAPHAVELYPHEFSGGQRQRIGLARALALNPRLIVTDEPVSAARRVDPVADPQPDEAPAGQPWPHVRVHFPRPVGGALHRRPDRGHVPGQARRDRHRGRRLRTPGPPLYRWVAELGPGTQPDAAAL